MHYGSAKRAQLGLCAAAGAAVCVRARSQLPEEFVESLAWHGIDATLIEAELDRRLLGEVMLDQAAAFGADLLVMGAYSQSPFRESLTRGVTNHILSHAELPVLMTH